MQLNKKESQFSQTNLTSFIQMFCNSKHCIIIDEECYAVSVLNSLLKLQNKGVWVAWGKKKSKENASLNRQIKYAKACKCVLSASRYFILANWFMCV